MTEDEVKQILHAYFGSLFPKVCSTCGRRFGTLLEYIQVTTSVGQPISYDANENNWNPRYLIGSAVLANCPCGTTLALTTEAMALPMRLELLNWVKIETQRRGIAPSDLLAYLRDKIRREALDDANCCRPPKRSIT
jgi:hypothetical protein